VEKFRALLAENNLSASELIGMDIPAGEKKRMELRMATVPDDFF